MGQSKRTHNKGGERRRCPCSDAGLALWQRHQRCPHALQDCGRRGQQCRAEQGGKRRSNNRQHRVRAHQRFGQDLCQKRNKASLVLGCRVRIQTEQQVCKAKACLLLLFGQQLGQQQFRQCRDVVRTALCNNGQYACTEVVGQPLVVLNLPFAL